MPSPKLVVRSFGTCCQVDSDSNRILCIPVGPASFSMRQQRTPLVPKSNPVHLDVMRWLFGTNRRSGTNYLKIASLQIEDKIATVELDSGCISSFLPANFEK